MLAKAHIIGYLGGDPEARTLNNGNEMVTMSVATSRRWRDKESGERQDKTSWHDVVIYNKALVEPCKKYLKKGSKVVVMGDLECRQYEDKDSGKTRTKVEIVVSAFSGEVVFLDKKEGGGAERAPAAEEKDLESLPY
jgi:single-strand DNA-binding protein